MEDLLYEVKSTKSMIYVVLDISDGEYIGISILLCAQGNGMPSMVVNSTIWMKYCSSEEGWTWQQNI